MITLKELEEKIRIAVNILQSDPYYSKNHKTYLFKLLFFKRISDVFEEEAETTENKTSDRELAGNAPRKDYFLIPEGCGWNDLHHIKCNLGIQLSQALTNIESANPKLRGVFVNAEDNEWEKLDEKVLLDLVEVFSTLNLKNSNLAQTNLLGNISENLIEIYALNGGMKGGDSSTPPQVAKLLVRLAEPSENMKICDPVCGSGSLLAECINQIKNAGGNPDNLSLYGQEINYYIWSIAKINLLLHNINKFNIRLGDSIRNPQLVDEHGNLINFDRVIANPPLNLKDWGHEIAETDIYRRFHYGIPPKSEGNFAFIQHILAILNKTGKASVLMSQGILINEGLNVNIRKNIIEEDLIEAVVELPSNLLYNSSIPAVILVFNRDKIDKRKGIILLIDASQEYKSGKKKNYLQDKNIDKIFSTYNNFQNKDGYAKIVSIEELAVNNYVINIKQHISASIPKLDIQTELSKEISKLSDLETERNRIESEINQYIRALGINP